MGRYVLRISGPVEGYGRDIAQPIRAMSLWFEASSDEMATRHILRQSFAKLLAANPSAVLYDHKGRVVCGGLAAMPELSRGALSRSRPGRRKTARAASLAGNRERGLRDVTDEAPHDGFLYELSVPDAEAPGGRRPRHVYVVAQGREQADAMVLSLLRDATFVASGPQVLRKARELEVADGGLRVVGRQA